MGAGRIILRFLSSKPLIFVNIQIEDVNSTRKNVIVSIAADELSSEQDSLLKEFSGQARIQGFRAGKAPAHLVKARYTKELREELNRKMVTSAYEKITKESELKIYGVVDIQGAEIEDTKEEANITFVIDIQPEFELPEYKGLEVHKHPEEIEDEEVEKVIERMLAQRADYNAVERAAEKGDYVKVAYEGKIGDEAIADIAPDKPMYGKQPVTWEEAGNENAPGIQAIVQGIVGMAKDDKKSVEHVFADDFEVEALAGKTASYEIEVQEVRERVLPPMDEEFLKTMQVETEEQLRESIQKQLVQQKSQENNDHMREQLIGILVEKVEFDVPESAVERETQNLLSQHMSHYMQQGVTAEMFEANKDELFESARKAGETHVRSEMVLAKVAEAEKIEVTDQDLQQRIMQEAYTSGKRPDELVKELQKERSRVENLRRSVLVNKTLEFLLGCASVSVKEACECDEGCGCGHNH